MGRSGLRCSMCSVLCRRTTDAWAGVTSEEVEHAIREGVRFLKERQAPDGSWADADAGRSNRDDQPGRARAHDCR